MARSEQIRHVTDPRALRALAHPVRVALLDHLVAVGPQTASECAPAVGASASSCSWHLRHLARFGFVEETESTDGRERPWRATATGFRSEPAPGGEGDRIAEALLVTGLAAEEDAVWRHVEARDRLEPEWREATDFHTYHLVLTVAELRNLTARIDETLRPYIAPTREAAPEDARLVRIHVRAFRSPAEG